MCRCGNRGCLETYVSSGDVTRLLAATHGADPTVPDVVAAALAGEVGCGRIVGDTGRLLGTAVATLCNTVNPELVVVGGEIARAGELLLGPLREVVSRHGVHGSVQDLRIETARLGNEAHVAGAVLLALQHASAPRRGRSGEMTRPTTPVFDSWTSSAPSSTVDRVAPTPRRRRVRPPRGAAGGTFQASTVPSTSSRSLHQHSKGALR